MPTDAISSGAERAQPTHAVKKHLQTGRRQTQIELLCELDINRAPVFRKTGIICTIVEINKVVNSKMRDSLHYVVIGPATHDVETLKKMITTGMNIARLNFSHGSYEYHAETIANLREALRSLKGKRTIAIALDTKGPEIRTGVLAGGATAEVELLKDASLVLTTDPKYKDKCTEEKIYVDYNNITKVITPGKRIFIDDGLISLRAVRVEKETIACVVENGGKLGSRKGINLPGTAVDLPAVTEKDVADLKFAVEQVFLEIIETCNFFPRSIYLRFCLNIGYSEADGIMVARGDLGIEIPPEQVFLVQKTLTAKCNRVGKPVICATQMLESMVHKPRPTRAESSDVANAVLDGVDCVMLSGETAKGDYPIEALLMMHQVCREAESTVVYPKYFGDLIRVIPKPTDMAQTIAIAATSAVESCQANGIICRQWITLDKSFLTGTSHELILVELMASGETAKGDYPIEALLMMHQVCREAESTVVYPKYFGDLIRVIPKPTDMAQTIAIAATSAVESCQANGIICVTNNGRHDSLQPAARMISHCRPAVPIYAVTCDGSVARQLHLHRGVFPLVFEGEMSDNKMDDLEKLLDYAIGVGKECGYMQSGDLLIVVTGANEGDGRTNALRIMVAP
ncbi:Pyruvate kinase PKM [Toxocara canis]|uniref:Pyruvate kinase n=1 Tax=Toxocara canis TaxID=6265 RepID=A0A0B2VBE3_TOXCA|nr:Pyruvate kinase PKM [Toxocara canis]